MGIEGYKRRIEQLKRKKKVIEEKLEYNLKQLGRATERNIKGMRERRKRLSKNPL